MLRATLTFVRRGEALVTATSLAVLDAPDEDFLARHVAGEGPMLGPEVGRDRQCRIAGEFEHERQST